MVVVGLAAPTAFAGQQPSSAAKQLTTTAVCQVGDLKLSEVGVDYAMQKAYDSLVFVNTSDHTCTMTGFPEVQFVLSANGKPVGLPATHNTGFPVAAVSLNPGDSTTAALLVLNSAVFDPTTCNQVNVAGVNVTLPDSAAPVFMSFPHTACAGDIGRSLMDIGPIGSVYSA